MHSKSSPMSGKRQLSRRDNTDGRRWCFPELFLFNLKWIREQPCWKCCTLGGNDISSLYTEYSIPSPRVYRGSSTASAIHTVTKAASCNTLKSGNALLELSKCSFRIIFLCSFKVQTEPETNESSGKHRG